MLFNLHCETDRVSEEAVQVVEEWLHAASSDYSENVLDVPFEGFYGKLGGPCRETDLFTSVPLQYTCRLLHDLLLNGDSLSERTQLSPAQIIALTEFCMKEGNHFDFPGRFFAQKQGAPMGSPLSPVLAEPFTEHMEEKAFSTRAPKFPIKAFKRYVDDIFAIIRRSSEQPFLDHLNRLFADTICFTMEVEQHGRLPFLGTLLIRKQTNISSQVYRKPTNTDHFVHYMSNHPLGVKRALIMGLVDRAYHLCDPQFLDRELWHIKTVLHHNGYPHRLIDSTVARRLQHHDSAGNAPRPSPDTKITIPLPFYRGISDKVLSLSRDLGFVLTANRPT
ncbi:hypothetical protein M513_13772 [Trichuris suis]|uniref:Reverse transcriptase domain-containing protein n=1 Tax=Trichuris suis TaxID=68888 RepID=A0A085LK56_9BILA|nr:hypothetical protein M513_13772 [Trichuris suis]